MIPSPVIVKYDPALFDAIHRDVPTFLSPEDHKEAIRLILAIAGSITILHLVLLQSMWLWSKKKTDAILKASYQITNFMVNLTLGCVGIYYQLFKIQLDGPILDRIVGNDHLMLFSVGQVGYQLWALPIGIFFVGETKAMIIHHLSVICVGSVSAFISCGFRYFTPFFYGVIEISSVPLSIMNSFKNNPEWIKKYPGAYNNVRLVFGLVFLLVRVVLWTPIFWNFVSLAAMLLYSSDVIRTQIILSLFIAAALILTLLQYFWASKIVGVVVKSVTKKKATKKED